MKPLCVYLILPFLFAASQLVAMSAHGEETFEQCKAKVKKLQQCKKEAEDKATKRQNSMTHLAGANSAQNASGHVSNLSSLRADIQEWLAATKRKCNEKFKVKKCSSLNKRMENEAKDHDKESAVSRKHSEDAGKTQDSASPSSFDKERARLQNAGMNPDDGSNPKSLGDQPKTQEYQPRSFEQERNDVALDRNGSRGGTSHMGYGAENTSPYNPTPSQGAPGAQGGASSNSYSPENSYSPDSSSQGRGITSHSPESGYDSGRSDGGTPSNYVSGDFDNGNSTEFQDTGGSSFDGGNRYADGRYTGGGLGLGGTPVSQDFAATPASATPLDPLVTNTPPLPNGYGTPADYGDASQRGSVIADNSALTDDVNSEGKTPGRQVAAISPDKLHSSTGGPKAAFSKDLLSEEEKKKQEEEQRKRLAAYHPTVGSNITGNSTKSDDEEEAQCPDDDPWCENQDDFSDLISGKPKINLPSLPPGTNPDNYDNQKNTFHLEEIERLENRQLSRAEKVALHRAKKAGLGLENPELSKVIFDSTESHDGSPYQQGSNALLPSDYGTRSPVQEHPEYNKRERAKPVAEMSNSELAARANSSPASTDLPPTLQDDTGMYGN